jgi:voltage-gated sodium channel
MVALAQRLVAHRVFQGGIIGVILLAGALAGVETDPALVAAWSPGLRWLNHAILAVFTLEILLKVTACGREPRRFFADGWNVFDCVIVALCFLPAAGPFAGVLRLSRVLRLLRLVSALPKLQLLVGALLKSLSAMGYVSLLLALMFYVYAVAGVHLFGQADPGDFGSLPAALFTLFRVVTLDNWGDAFARVSTAVPGLVVTLYFVTFIVLGTMIILNLFIGIVMNSMAEMHRELEENRAPAATVTAALDAVETQLAALQRQVRAARVDAERLVRPPPGATG